jgi:hypothetical protein
MDIKMAFLYKDIDAKIYIEQLDGYIKKNNLVC